MRFGEQFEFHKIPEWYNQYLNYELFKKKIEQFKESQKKGDFVKLPGYYIYLIGSRKLVCLDLVGDHSASIDSGGH